MNELVDGEQEGWRVYLNEGLSFGHDDDEASVDEYRKILPVDPCFPGAGLGDGTRMRTPIANNHDAEMVDILKKYAAVMGKRSTVYSISYSIVSVSARYRS